MITLRAALLAILAAVAASPPADAAEGIPAPREILEACVRSNQPWHACYDQAKADGLLPEDTRNRAETCVLAGGDVHYCFPHLKPRQTARTSDFRGIWFFLRPRSLWTPTAYDLLRDSDR